MKELIAKARAALETLKHVQAETEPDDLSGMPWPVIDELEQAIERAEAMQHEC